MGQFTRGELEELSAGVYDPEPVVTQFDGTTNNGKILAAAALTTALTGTNNDLTFTAATEGSAGNNITIEYRDPGAGGQSLVVDCSGTTITVRLATSAGVKATATLTSSGVFQDDETVTIGSTVYTFKTALSSGPAVPYEVLIGASAAASLDNLKSAVNGTAGAGTTYATGTVAHPTVTATTNADDSQVFEAITLGTAGNSIASTETCANNAFGGATFSGGEDIGQITSTAADVDAAIDAMTEAAALVTPANAGGNDGTGVVTAMAATNLTGGSDGTVTLFTATEDGLIALVGDCSESLAGATATLKVGTANDDDILIPSVTATDVDVDERLDKTGLLTVTTAPDVTPFFPVRAGDVVKITVGTASITDGTISWKLFYKQFSNQDRLLARIVAATEGTGTSANQVQGTAAHDAVSTGNPVLEGGYASDAAPTDVADGDAVRAWNKRNGARAVYDAYSRDEDTDSITAYDKGVTYTRLSADGIVSAVPVGLVGYYVEASSTGVISLYDNASAGSGNAMLALSKAVTTNDVVMLDKPILMTNGVYFDLVSGTATVSVFTRKTVAQ